MINLLDELHLLINKIIILLKNLKL